jgi:sec-independent protein translocase protein TatC
MTAIQGRVPEPDPSRMTLVEHLTELRNRVFKAVLAIAVGALVGFLLYPQIFDILIEPYCAIDNVPRLDSGECALVMRDPLGGFKLRFMLAGYTGLFLASPVVLWQLWRFITPGLYENEKKYAVPFVLSAVVLFLTGAALAFWTIPKAFEFLFSIGGDQLTPFLEPNAYLSFITFMMVAFGVGFLFPILLVFLQLAGALTSRRLRSWRRYAIVIIVVLVAVITPSGDPVSLLALSVPMYVFYEASIIIGRVIERRRARAAAAAP